MDSKHHLFSYFSNIKEMDSRFDSLESRVCINIHTWSAGDIFFFFAYKHLRCILTLLAFHLKFFLIILWIIILYYYHLLKWKLDVNWYWRLEISTHFLRTKKEDDTILCSEFQNVSYPIDRKMLKLIYHFFIKILIIKNLLFLFYRSLTSLNKCLIFREW